MPDRVSISIVDYDPGWPRAFEREAAKILAALASRVVAIEHVGSTAVPGLAAKPIIDIVLVVADSSAEQDYAPALAQAGYTLRIREPDWYQHRLFKDVLDSVNLHVFSAGCVEVGRMLIFRDWLRSNESDRELYAARKRALAGQHWKSVDEYAAAKTGIVQEIMARAALSAPDSR